MSKKIILRQFPTYCYKTHNDFSKVIDFFFFFTNGDKMFHASLDLYYKK